MNEIWLFVLAALACFRLSELFAIDEGPFRVFFWVRYVFGAYDKGENKEPKSSWGRLIICPWCLGLWFAFLAAVFLWWGSSPTHIVLIWLALAGAQAALQGGAGRT